MRFPYRFARFLCQWSMVLLLKARVFGRRHVPATGGVLLVSNHQSFMDPVLATMALPREGNYMARDSLFANRWFGGLIEYLNAFAIKRGTADLMAIKETMRRLKGGKVVLAFPEGTRTPDGRVGAMLAGLATVAKKCEVPIVPVLIDGVYQAWPRDRLLPGRGDVVIEYGRPLMPVDYAGLTPDGLTAEIRGRIIAMQERWHRRVPSRRLEWYADEDKCEVRGEK
ncbi:MAG: 1-acyl-sn-glycerol-3-phosphate acyltransferase [Planctomycetes bacterium]|nr:1-acyl-sn-glycerol-3-phosphate acyltransferase [Planctomycetota bacterium]